MERAEGPEVVVIAGGVGAARLLRGVVEVIDPASVTAVVNVGDDFDHLGLRICPDLDTCTYTLSDEVEPTQGWGRRSESWTVMAEVEALGGPTWFSLGDRDLALHMVRTARLATGAPLSQVTAEVTAAFGIGAQLIPATDDRLSTVVTVADGSGSVTDVGFQEYFVAMRHEPPVTAVRFDGADDAKPAPGVLDAIASADRIVIAPSNPILSVDPVLAVPGIADALADRRADVVAVSPLIGGAAVKGPADRLMATIGAGADSAGIAAHYRSVASALVIDEADRADTQAVAATGLAPVVTPTLMGDVAAAARLAQVVLDT